MSARLLIVDHAAADFDRSRITLARHARRRGFDVHVAVPERSQSHDGFAIHTYPLARLGTSPHEDARTVGALASLYRELRPAVVHHFGIKPALLGGLAARLAEIQAVLHTFTGLGFLARGDATWARRAAIAGLRFALAAPANHVVCQIAEDAVALLRLGIARPERLHVIDGLGVDLRRFHPTEERAGTPVVLMASRLVAEKGVQQFVRAARALKRREIAARFVLLGGLEPDHPTAIPEHLLAGWTKDGDVEWLGTKHDMPRWIADAHVVCLPTSYGEGIPRILLEGAASARAIVATDQPGCRRVVQHGVNGLLVPACDPDAFANAIATLVRDRSLRVRMGAAGRERTTTLFDEDQITQRYVALYRELS